MAEDAQVVLVDASAVLAVMFRERGAESVAPFLSSAIATNVVMMEILSKMAQKGMTVVEARYEVEDSGLRWRTLGPDSATLAADYLLRFRTMGISLADATCLAMGDILRVPILTADKDWAKLGLALDIRVIR